MGELSISADKAHAARLRLSGDASGADVQAVRDAAAAALDGSTAELILDVNDVTAIGTPFLDLLRELAALASRLQRSIVLEVPEAGVSWWSTPISPAIRIEPTRTAAWAAVKTKPAVVAAEQGAPRREGAGYVTSYGPGRRCAAPGCTTTLSRYNGDPMCWIHNPDSGNRRA